MIKSGSNADNIHVYRKEIKPAFPDIPSFEVLLPRFGLTLNPWNEWIKRDGVPLWWTAYNKTKHHRDSDYGRANLKNALNTVSALFVMVLYLYKDKAVLGELRPSPKLLRTDAKHHGGIGVGGYDSTIVYSL